MQEITTLVATLILPATIATVPICFVVYALKDRERPFREAVDKAQTLVASGAVWLALALAGLFGVLESLDRWGVGTFMAVALGPSVVLGVALGVVTIWRQGRREVAVSAASPAMSRTPDEEEVTP